MLFAVMVCVLLVVFSTYLHYEALSNLNQLLPRITLVPRRAKVLAAVLGAMLSHASHVSIFAGAYFLLKDHFGLGAFGGQFRDSFTSFLYFSIETYTSLGLGDIYPLGPLRMLAGVEALTGLLMISWTASFTYLEMNRYWTNR
jgi:hypothetical protein